jgi:imidazolonepropionase-like amidohydrolase
VDTKTPGGHSLLQCKDYRSSFRQRLFARTVWLHDGRIKQVVDYHTSEMVPDDCQEIDLEGKYLCPVLIDCHVHLTAGAGASRVKDLYDVHSDTLAYLTAWTAKKTLLRGFTIERDCAGANSALRDAIAEGLILGPSLFIAGKALSQTGGHGDLRSPYQDDSFKCCSGHGPGLARICDGVPACLAAARDELRMGADFLKIMVGGGVASPVDPLDMLQFSPEEIQVITRSASNLGKYVTAHAYTIEAIRRAVENGVRAIEHGNFVHEATPKYCKEKDIVVTPTLVTYEALTSEEFRDFLPESGVGKGQVVLASGVESLKVWRDAGVMICFGTDLLAGMQTQQNEEFRIRKKCLSGLEVLQSATVNAAKLLGIEGKIGEVKEGAFADLLILDADPLDDVAVLADMKQHCCGILKEGRVVVSKLEEAGLVKDKAC